MEINPKFLDSKVLTPHQGKTEKANKTEKSLKESQPLSETKKESPLDQTKLSLSSKARDFQKAKALTVKEQNPLEYEKKVARLQKLIDEGKYEVDADEVAHHLLKEHLLMDK